MQKMNCHRNLQNFWDGILVDGFVFSNSPRARQIAKLFPDIIFPICFSHRDRLQLHDFVSHGCERFINRFEKYSANDSAFHDGKTFDLIFFEGWWRKNESRLEPPKEDDLFVDLIIPANLQCSEMHGYRTAYYLALSQYLGIPYSSHPFRHLVLGALLVNEQLTSNSNYDFSSAS